MCKQQTALIRTPESVGRLVLYAFPYTEWVKGKPSEAYVIRKGFGTRFEHEKLRAEVSSRSSVSFLTELKENSRNLCK